MVRHKRLTKPQLRQIIELKWLKRKSISHAVLIINVKITLYVYVSVYDNLLYTLFNYETVWKKIGSLVVQCSVYVLLSPFSFLYRSHAFIRSSSVTKKSFDVLRHGWRRVAVGA